MSFDCLRRCALEPGDRSVGHAALLEVLGKRHRVALAVALEPVAREPVTEDAIGIGQHRVRGIANERMSKCELILSDGARAPFLDHLAFDEQRHAAVELARRGGVAEQRFDARPPEELAEHTRCTQRAARIGG
ncbi:MAG: hypothetical protein H0T89_26395 [Deltaproteobacteria bacterium]|nr:hypothetical protein [Deltaproteobacteria bacterium]